MSAIEYDSGVVICCPINAPGMVRFILFDLVGYNRVWDRVRIWDRVRVTVGIVVTVRVSVCNELGSGKVYASILGLGLDYR